MILRFYARDDQLVPLPGQVLTFSGGMPVRYVGREFVPAEMAADGKVVKPSQNPATEHAFEVDSDSHAGQRLRRQLFVSARQGCASLWAADEVTAAACGVPFVKVAHRDGAWVAAESDDERRAKKLQARTVRRQKAIASANGEWPAHWPQPAGDKTKPGKTRTE